MNYLGNHTNLVRDAVLSALNIVPSTAIYRVDTAPKAGGGSVTIEGPYTGQHDSTIDIRVSADPGATALVSRPVFAGVGNGIIAGVSADNAVARQEVVITLEDLGTDTRAAYVPFQGVTLVARAPGPGGNAITIRVDPSSLVATPTDFAVQGGLRAGVNEYIGDEFHFGAVTLAADGRFPNAPDAPRLRFGLDPQVYRPYRFYRDGQYVYGFSPAPVRDVPAGARVYAVTGARTVTITDGATTDTLGGIVTLYDCLNAIRSSSTLLQVDGVIVNDRKPGGQGVTDLSVWTMPYVQSLMREGTEHAKQADIQLTVDATAPTEALVIRCRDAAATGRETWDVRGDVSGLLASAQTGVPYTAGAYSFLIAPPAVAGDVNSSATITVEYQPQPRGDGESVPKFCVVKPRLGAAARNGKWRFVLRPRPPEDCDCASGELIGGPREDCLGVSDDETGGGIVSDASRLIRLGRLKNAVSELIASNTAPPSAVDVGDVQWIQASAQILLDCLNKVVAGTLAYPSWAASKLYGIDDVVEPVMRNGYRYAVTTGGTSAATEPAVWPTTEGDTVTDGTVVWANVGKVPLGMWDQMFEDWKTEAAMVNGVEATTRVTWSPERLIRRNWRIIPTIPNGHYYTATDITTVETGVSVPDGKTSEVEPRWPTDGSSFVEVSHDWYIEWTDQGVDDFITANFSAAFHSRYRSRAGAVLAAAGIDENFEGAGVNGDGCWQDFNDRNSWWVFDGDELYKPVQTGHYYHSVIGCNDESGNPSSRSTHEFGFGPKFGNCENLLKEGDAIVVTIQGIPGGGNGYQQGDTFSAAIVRGKPLEMGGGQAGDDTLTWSVVGSVDGGLPPYALLKTAPAPYAAGGLEFLVTPGGIPFALGDQFRFSIENGQFEWRRDGGAWSSPIDIATTPLADGLVAQFAGGAAPSWVAGDTWSFRAEAVNGVDALRQPTDARCAWAGSTVIDIGLASSESARSLLICDHAIAADAAIVLEGSNDDFASIAASVPVPWRERHIYIPVDDATTCASWRLRVDRDGSIQWLRLGAPLALRIRTGSAELGMLTKRVRLSSLAARQALGGSIEHTHLTQDSADALIALLDHACAHDDRRFAIVPNDAEADVSLVTYDDDTLELTDRLGFQPRSTEHRLIALTLAVSPVA